MTTQIEFKYVDESCAVKPKNIGKTFADTPFVFPQSPTPRDFTCANWGKYDPSLFWISFSAYFLLTCVIFFTVMFLWNKLCPED